MKKFEFSSTEEKSYPIFHGNIFYCIYKTSHFLQQKENVEKILSKGYELRIMLKDVEPGQSVAVGSMMLSENTPLLVKKTGPNVVVESFEFTANRLSGFVAAYAFDKRHLFPELESTEAKALGLTWDHKDEKKCRLYLSAVTGTEHFERQFGYWPLVCGLRKLQLKKITLEPVLKMAKVKNCNGSCMAKEFIRNRGVVMNLWSQFSESSPADLDNVLRSLPPQMMKLFTNVK